MRPDAFPNPAPPRPLICEMSIKWRPELTHLSVAKDAAATRAILDTDGIDVIVLDASTSDIAGANLAMEARDRGIRLVMISGNPTEMELFQNRADQLLWKPVPPSRPRARDPSCIRQRHVRPAQRGSELVSGAQRANRHDQRLRAASRRITRDCGGFRVASNRSRDQALVIARSWSGAGMSSSNASVGFAFDDRSASIHL